MINNLKALVVILIIAIPVFEIAKPVCLRFMAESDFARRRNVWIILTITAFVSPSFWLFAIVAMPLVAWSARKDTNPLALYVLLMHVVPPIGIEIPAIVVNRLFPVSSYTLLNFAILIPAAWRLVKSSQEKNSTKFTLIDILILSYAGLQLALLVPHESITNIMRRGFLLLVEGLVVYFVFSRTCTDRRTLVETMASFCLACAIMAPLAIFEALRHWLLYSEIREMWSGTEGFYLLREGTLRAQVAAAHSLDLGYLLAVAFGFWLFLRSRVQSALWTIAVAIWFCVGLLAAYSRAPWIVAALIFFTYLALGPDGVGRFLKSLLVSALVAGVILVSPVGERVIDNLPFLGRVDAANVTYRVQLATRSWEVVQQNPFFGDPFFILRLEDLRQGQGIIDLVNAYAVVSMSHGLVGLCLFLGPLFVGMWNAYGFVRKSARPDPDLSLLGANLIACMLGTMLMMATGGANTGNLRFVLIGFLVGYAYLGQTTTMAQARQFDAIRS